MAAMKPAAILKKYFGLKEDQDNMGFMQELRALKEDQEDYKEMVILAAEELGVEPDFS
jgi:hypothetical protein